MEFANDSFLVIDDAVKQKLLGSLIETKEQLRLQGSAINSSQEGECANMVKSCKDEALKKVKAHSGLLKDRLSKEVRAGEVRKYITTVSGKLEQASTITPVAAQLEHVDKYKTDANSMDILKNSFLKSVETLYNKHSQTITKLGLQGSIKASRSPAESQKYLEEVMAIIEKVLAELAEFEAKINAVATDIENLVQRSVTTEKELANIDRCLAEIILPELAKRQQLELVSKAFITGYQKLIINEGQAKKSFVECLIPKDEEIVLPKVYVDLLNKEAKIAELPAATEWPPLKEECLSLPERMSEAFSRTDNSCFNMKECDRATTQLSEVQANIDQQEALASDIVEKTEDVLAQIKEDLEKARQSESSINLEQAQIGELQAVLSKLIAQKQSQDLLIKQKKEVVENMQREAVNLETSHAKAVKDSELELQIALEEFSVNEKSRYKKTADLQELQVECEALAEQKAKFTALLDENDVKYEERNALNNEFCRLQDIADLLTKEISQMKAH